MKDIKQAPFIKDICKIASNLYRLGWDERNGGNISYLVSEEEAAEYADINSSIRNIPVNFDGTDLIGKIFVVTGTGKYFKNIEDNPEENLGLVRVADDGKSVDLIWGYSDGSRPTSELPAHLMSHIERLKLDPNHRIIIHTHPTNLIAMTFVHSLDEREFTRTLWKMITECLVVFPDGIGILPWMVCGGEEIGIQTAEKMKEYRVVVWAQHGVFGAGTSIDEAFGLIETVEKAAEIYMKIAHLPIKQYITDDQFKALARAFNIEPKKEFLD